MTIAAATSRAAFLAFVELMLIPALGRRPDAVVVLTNLAAPQAERVQAAFPAAGIACRRRLASAPDP